MKRLNPSGSSGSKSKRPNSTGDSAKGDSVGSPSPSRDTSSDQSDADSGQTPPATPSPPPLRSPSPTLKPLRADDESHLTPARSSSLPLPPSGSAPAKDSSPPPSPPPPRSPPPPPPSSPSSPPPSPPASKMSPPPPSTEKDTPPSSMSLPGDSLPPPGPSSSSEFIPPPPPRPPPPNPPPPGSNGSLNIHPASSSRNVTSGLGTSLASNRTSHSTPSSSSSSSSSVSSSSSRGSSPTLSTTTETIIAVAAAGVFFIALIGLVFMIVQRRKKKEDTFKPQYALAPNIAAQAEGAYYEQNTGFSGHSNNSYYATQSQHSGMGNSYGNLNGHVYHGGGVHEPSLIGGTKIVFSYEELMEITSGFSRQNIIGEGGFGCVYKGQLPNGRFVAVKQLKIGSGQGDREFRAEVEIISRVHHRHLVSLVGYCISEQQRLLIYEFVPNKTLDHHLHGNGMPVLEWTKRVKIALGSAKGLAYLHEDCHPKIIHRDIKSANILLDDAFEAQVSDFGLAKLSNDTNTHVSTRVMGTFGYLAPEYASSGKLTDRSDVFSFGVVLLELVTGRRPVDASQPLGDESLVEWARPLLIRALETGDISELVDPRLGKSYVEIEVFRMIEAAAACIRHSAPKRPRMVQVIRALDNDGEMSDLSNGVKVGQSTVYNSDQYSQDIVRFRQMAVGDDDSMEYGTSGEYSGTNPASWRSLESSVEFTSGELETRAMKPLRSGKRF